MRISMLQIKIQLGDFPRNCHTVEAAVKTALQDRPDIIVLPEMWNIGFFPRPVESYADKNGENSQTFLSALAKQYSVNIVGGSIARKENDNLYNTCYVFNRWGNLVASYDKLHLFSPAKEDKLFQSGNRPQIFTLDGWRCGVAICYDLRFCEMIRLLALAGIDILFVPAAWPMQRKEHWQILNQARAIENQMYVAAVNSSGAFGEKFPLCGSSMLIDPWGNIISKANEAPQVLTGECSHEPLQQIRENMHVFHDRRPEAYQLMK